VSTYIDIYLGNSTRPLNVDFSRFQHSAPTIDFFQHPHSKSYNVKQGSSNTHLMMESFRCICRQDANAR